MRNMKSRSQSLSRLIYGKTVHELHITALQSVLVNVNNTITRNVPLHKQSKQRYEGIVESKAIFEGFIPGESNQDISIYAEMCIGEVFRHQYRFATEDAHKAMSITHLLLSLLEGYPKDIKTRYVGFIDENAATRSAMHKSF